MPEEKTVMDEMNAALGVESIVPENTDDDIIEGDNHEGSEIPSKDSEGIDSESGNDGTDGVSDADGNLKGDGTVTTANATITTASTERDDKGKFKKKEPEVKKADPVNDPIPRDLKKETQERIRTLIDTTKNVTAERDKAIQDFNFLVQGVERTGTSPEQYGETLSWLALFNSPDPKNQEKALELVETVAERLATLLGKERTVGDPLSVHPDLKEAVTKGQITAQYAKEIARTRNGQAFRTEINTNATQAEQQRQATAQELETARTGLSALEQTLQGTDPQYPQKKEILVQALKPIFASIPPSQWVAKFQEAYKNLKLNPMPKAKTTPIDQPLRAGKQPAGGQTKAPGSMLEAISGALNGMGK